MANSAPTIDTNALKNYLMVDSEEHLKEFLRELIPIFKEDANTSFIKLAEAVKNGTTKEIIDHAHSLKSCARNLALINLGDSCQVIEQAAEQNDATTCSKLIPELETKKDEAILALAALI